MKYYFTIEHWRHLRICYIWETQKYSFSICNPKIQINNISYLYVIMKAG